ncbi:MAG: glycosyltransferase family 4 protein [Parachlamydiales bacterium]|nr:glycosyltransferase family 4 protein [Parachlamydiales bacterium]
MKDFFSKRQLLKGIFEELLFLQKIEKKRLFKSDGASVYLRTDHYFGLQSGGSVGHIAGVLNNLQNPIFITSDTIPTVKQHVEKHQILPNGDFRDFRELPALHYNRTFVEAASERIGNRNVSFIYQRYSIHNFSGIKLAERFQVPLVLEYNGSELWVKRWWGNAPKYERLIEDIEMLNLQQADMIVVVSKALKSQLLARGINEDKILVNPNGVEPDIYSPDVPGDAIREKYDLKGKIVIGFIGTFGKWHGAEVLAEAFAKLLMNFPIYKKNVALFLIGNGETMLKTKKVLTEVMEFCRFSNEIPQSMGPSHLAACDLLISPHVPNPDGSAFFGSPTKLFEYMAMGKGIVASDLDQLGEILKHDQTAWLVKPADATSLMFGMKLLIDDEAKRSCLGNAARKEAVLRYAWKAHAERIMDRLKEISSERA